jgi:hypothetical protein
MEQEAEIVSQSGAIATILHNIGALAGECFECGQRLFRRDKSDALRFGFAAMAQYSSQKGDTEVRQHDVGPAEAIGIMSCDEFPIPLERRHDKFASQGRPAQMK